MQEKAVLLSFPALEALARVAPDSAPEPGLADRLRHALAAAGADGLAAFATALAATGNGPRLVSNLAAAADVETRRVALELAARLPVPLDPALAVVLRPLLLDRAIPADVHLAAAAVLLRSQADDAVAAEILQAVVAGLSRPRSLERLDQLELRVGRSSALDVLRERLELHLPMRCPRCPERQPRAEMVKHLWLAHRLLLDGRRVREPWELADELVRAYAVRKEPALLVRCFELASHADPKGGAERIRALLRAHKVRGDVEPMREKAAENGEAVCPRCHAAVPVRREGPLRALTMSRGRLAGVGYVVEVSEKGWGPRLEVLTPQGVLYRGPEEGSRWTPRTALLLLAGPPVALAVLVAALLNLLDVSAVIPVVLLLWVAVLAALAIRVRGVFTGSPIDRAVDHAWQMLVPRLHSNGFDRTAADFLAGLSLASIGHGRSEERSTALQGLLALTDKSLTAGEATPGQLAALWRLATEDGAVLGSDLVHAIARQISRAMEGSLPLAFADRLLEHWESEWWHHGNLARLRALVCERAFEAGFTIADLAAVGHAAPALGEVLEAEDTEALLRLRNLWTIQAERPWSRVGPAQTVFELAGHPTQGTRPLAQRPDLLLLPTLPESGPERRFGSLIELCSGGVRFGGTLLTELPRTIEAKAVSGGHELMVGPYRFVFREDPDMLGWRLERWCQYYFTEFLPQVSRAAGQSSAVAERLRRREAVACTECRQAFLSSVGEVGVAVSVENTA